MSRRLASHELGAATGRDGIGGSTVADRSADARRQARADQREIFRAMRAISRFFFVAALSG